ncbi:hypothetical protein D3C74_422990 [compost metagenome]
MGLSLILSRDETENMRNCLLVTLMLAERHEMHSITLLNEMDCNIFHFFIIEVVKPGYSFGGGLDY